MHDQNQHEIWLRNLEQIDDLEELARTLHESGVTPSGDTRLKRLFVRAIRGNGAYSLAVRINCEPA
jgi:hypothetical protein